MKSLKVLAIVREALSDVLPALSSNHFVSSAQMWVDFGCCELCPNKWHACGKKCSELVGKL